MSSSPKSLFTNSFHLNGMGYLSMTFMRGGICASLIVLFLGCTTYGPKQLEQGHLAYNAAVKASADDELLLNIVRLRYLDTMEFLSSNSISAQTSISVSLSGEFGNPGFSSGDKTRALVQPGIAYSNRPTFTFTPQRGLDFARRFIAPVEVKIINYLMATDWDVDLMLRLLVREMNGLRNELGLVEPEYTDLLKKLRTLWLKNQTFFGFVPETDVLSDPIAMNQVSGSDLVEAARSGFRFKHAVNGSSFVLTAERSQPVLYIEPGSEEAQAVIRSLRLNPEFGPYYRLMPGRYNELAGLSQKDVIVRTASLLSVLIYLAQGVQVPESHLDQGLTIRDFSGTGGENQNIDDLFVVKISRSKPAASTAVKYRGYWFYIEEADAISRTTFLFVAELFRLSVQSTESEKGPVLTLPVGGP